MSSDGDTRQEKINKIVNGGAVLLMFPIFLSETWTKGSVYYHVTTIVGEYFPLLLIIMLALYTPLAVVFWIGTNDEMEEKEDDENIGYVFISFVGVAVLLIGWFAPVALAAHRGGHDVLYSWGTMAYALGYAAFLPFLIAAFIVGFPIFFRGLVLARTGHPAKKAVERTVARRRPDYEIERELWAIMRRQDATDSEIERRFHELSPWRRWALRPLPVAARTPPNTHPLAEPERRRELVDRV